MPLQQWGKLLAWAPLALALLVPGEAFALAVPSPPASLEPPFQAASYEPAEGPAWTNVTVHGTGLDAVQSAQFADKMAVRTLPFRIVDAQTLVVTVAPWTTEQGGHRSEIGRDTHHWSLRLGMGPIRYSGDPAPFQYVGCFRVLGIGSDPDPCRASAYDYSQLPPNAIDFQPRWGPPGTIVTIRGENLLSTTWVPSLEGNQMIRPLAERRMQDDTTMVVTLDADVPPGSYGFLLRNVKHELTFGCFLVTAETTRPASQAPCPFAELPELQPVEEAVEVVEQVVAAVVAAVENATAALDNAGLIPNTVLPNATNLLVDAAGPVEPLGNFTGPPDAMGLAEDVAGVADGATAPLGGGDLPGGHESLVGAPGQQGSGTQVAPNAVATGTASDPAASSGSAWAVLAVTATTAFGRFEAARRAAKWFGLLVLLPLFSRLRKDRVLDHPLRQDLLDRIDADPGIHYQELVRQTGRGHGTVENHLRRLVAAGLVVAHRAGGFLRYYTPAARAGSPLVEQSLLRSPQRKSVLACVGDRGGLSLTGLAGLAGLSPSAAHGHVRHLEEAGLVGVRRLGREVRIEPTPQGLAALRRLQSLAGMAGESPRKA